MRAGGGGTGPGRGEAGPGLDTLSVFSPRVGLNPSLISPENRSNMTKLTLDMKVESLTREVLVVGGCLLGCHRLPGLLHGAPAPQQYSDFLQPGAARHSPQL